MKNDSLLANLAVWGVDSTELPTTIAESYLDQISASTDITLLEDSKTHALYTQLGKDGADAIENSVLGVKDALLSAVKAKYEAEINDSKVLANQSATKTALLGVLETAISNFETADTNGTTFSITQYIGTDVKVSGTAGLDEGEANVEASSKKIINGQGLGLIGYVEYCLAQPVNGSTNQAWLAERISNAKTEVSKTLKTARDSISDEKYDSLASYTTKTVNNVTTYTPEEAVLGNGDISKEIDNPLFTWTPGTGDTKSATPKTSSVAAVSVSGTDTSAHYDLDEWLDTLSKATIPEATSSYDEKGNWIGGTLNVQSWAQGHVADFEKIYEEGLGLIKGSLDAQVSSAISGSGLTTTGYVSSAKVTESWDSLSPDTDSTDFATASEFINTADSISSNVSLLKTLNDGITSWLDETVDEDPQFKDYFGLPTDTDSVSDTRKAFEEELSAVLAGNVSSSSLNSWLRNLDSVYEDDVAGYLETAKDLLTQRYQEKVSRADTVEESRALTSVINSFNSFVGHKVKESNGSYVVDDAKGTFDFTCTTITNIFKWLNDGYASLTAHSIVLSAVNEENIDTKTPITGTDGITQFTNAASFKLEAIGDNAWKASGDTFALTESNFNAIGYGVGTECVAFSVDNLTAGNAAAVRWVSSVGAAFPESSPLLSYEKVEADGAIHVVAGLYGYVWNNGVTTEEEFSNEDTPVVLVRVWDDTEGKGSYTDYYFDFSSMFPAE